MSKVNFMFLLILVFFCDDLNKQMLWLLNDNVFDIVSSNKINQEHSIQFIISFKFINENIFLKKSNEIYKKRNGKEIL